MIKKLCIYHGNCADGFGAAWAVRKALGDQVEFHAGVYQDEPPDVTGRDVIIVDFSYKRPVLEQMAQVARSVLILDHHKSAAEDLAGFPPPISKSCGWDDHLADVRGRSHDGTDPGTPRALFDMERSGAGITWDFFHGHVRRPELIDIIEDRDLWRFKYPNTRAVQAAIFSYPYDFEVWDDLMDPSRLSMLATEGGAIERKHHKDIAELVGVCQRLLVIGGCEVPAASLPYTLTSDAGHLMARGAPFAACYWDTPDFRVFSLRSTDGGMDVSEIAKAYGGGGHKNAAGFRVPLNQIAQFEPIEA